MGRSLSTWSPPWLWLSPALPSTVFNGSFLVPRSHTAEVFFGRATILRQPQQAKPFSEKSVSSGHAHTQQSRGHPLSRRHPGHSTTSKRAQPPAPQSQGHPLSRRHPDKKGQEQARRFRSRTRRLPTLPTRAQKKQGRISSVARRSVP